MSVRILNLPQASESADGRDLGPEAIKHAFLDNLFCVQGKTPALATRHDYYMALAYTAAITTERSIRRWSRRT